MPPRPQRLLHLLSLAQHRLLKSADLAFKETLDISTTQLGVLFLLEKRPGALFKDVSDELGVNASAITALIARMEDAGLVQRQRSVHLFATANGLAKSAAARPILARLNARLTGGFSEREIATVARFLNAILQRF